MKLTTKNYLIKANICKKSLRLFILLVLGLLLTNIGFAQNTYNGATGGTWGTNGNWSAHHIPLATEDVIIPNNKNVTVNVAGVCKSLTISSGGNASVVTISGTNSITVTNDISIGAGTGSGDNKTLAVGAGTVTCASIAVTAAGSNSRSSGISISTGSVTSNGNITMGDANDDMLFTGAGNLYIGGSGTMTGGTLTPSTGTVNYTGATQDMGVYTYYNLTINESSTTATVTSTNAITVNNNLSVIKGNLLLTATDNDYTINGDLSVSPGATLTHNVEWAIAGKQLTVNGNVAIDGTYSYAGVARAHLHMTGSGVSIRTGSSAVSILTLYTTGAVTASGTLTVNDNFWAMYNNTGSFSTNGQTVTANGALLSAGGTVNINGGTLNVSGGFYDGVGLTATGNGTVNFSAGTVNTDVLDMGDFISGAPNNTATGAFNQSGGTLNVSGGLNIKAASSFICSNSPAINIKGNWVNNGTYTKAGETVTFNGTGAQTISGTNTTQTFNNITFSNPTTVSVAASTTTLTLGGSLNITAGTFNVGTATTLNVAGNWANSGSFNAQSGTVNFNGGTAQTISGSSATTFKNVGLSNTNGLTLSGTDATVGGTLAFTNGRITTGANTLILTSTSATSITGAGAGKYINGNLRKGIANGAGVTQSFEIGDATNYTPVSLTFAGTVSGSGNLTAFTTVGDHPNIATSTISEDANANRYWTLTNSGVAGFTSYGMTLTFVAGDLDAGAATASFVVGKYNAAAWTYPTIGTRTSTTTAASGATTFGDFVVGPPTAAPPSIAAGGNPSNASGCSSGSFSFTAKANSTPGSSAQWQINTGSGFTNLTIASPYSVSTTTTSGVTTSVLSISSAISFSSGYQYKVTFTNSRGNVTSTAATLTLNAAPTPTFTAAPTPVCVNSTGNVYSTQPGNTNYQWVISGGTITVGGTTNSSSATVTWTATGTKTISVNYTNGGGCAAASPTVQNVTVGSLPTPAFTTAPTTGCQNGAYAYAAQSGNTNYQWAVVGGSFTAGGTTTSNTATVTWSSSGAKSVSVNYTVNGCTAASPVSQSVTVNPAPSVSVVASPTSICNGLSSTLTATNTGGTVDQTYSATSGALTQRITDNSKAAYTYPTLTLSGSGGATLTTTDILTVTLNITEDNANDLDIFLVDPSGNRAILLSADNGGSGSNYTNTVITTDPGVTRTLNSGSAPLTNTYLADGAIGTAPDRSGASSGNYNSVVPANALNYSGGASIDGDWSIRIWDDNSSGSNGTLTSWSLSITRPNSGPYNTTFSGPATLGTTTFPGNDNSIATVDVTPSVGSNVYTAVTTDGLGCSASNTATVTVNAVPVATVTNNSQTICSGSSIASMVLGTSNSVAGTTFNWTRTTTNIGGTVPTSGTNTTADIAGTLTNTTSSPITVTFTITPKGPGTTACQGANITASIIVNPASVGGSISGSGNVCYGTNSKLLTLSGYLGTIVKWQSSIDNGNNWDDFVNASATYTATNIVQTTLYRAVIQSGNCPSVNSGTATVTINTPPSPTITPNYCSAGGNVQLSSNAFSAYKWSTGATTQSVNVDLAGIYVVTVTDGTGCTGLNSITVATELVTNGNFSSGNTGFTSAYTNHQGVYITGDNTSGLFPEGLYAIGANANTWHPIFFGTDHTSPGTGNFMIVNGSSASTYTTVWTETITVQPNTDYYFSAFCTSLNQVGPYAQLQFQANGNQVGTVASLTQGAASTAGPFVWTRFYGTWNSGSSSTVVLSITDLQTAAGGNDFGLDDISCSTLSPVTFTTTPNSISSTVCAGDNIGLAANTSGGAGPYSYKWNGPNAYTSTAQNPTITGATTAASGTYTVTVTNGYGCTTSGSTAVTVGSYPLNKTVTAVASAVCSGTSTNIQVASVQAGVSYQLRNNADNSLIGAAATGTAGSTVSLSTGNLTANTTFNVLATNTTTFCAVQMTTTPAVTVSTTPALVITNQAACTGTVNLTASGVTAGSTGGGALTYWTNAGATSSLSSPSAVATSGTYYIKSTVVSCFDIEPVTVTISATPKATFSYTGTPYCSSGTNPSPTFSGGGTAGVFSSTTGLVFVSASTGQVNLAASTAGTYTVTNTITPSGACSPVSANSTIKITKLPVADFSYSSNSLCQNATGSNPSPTFLNGGAAGTFSSSFGLSFVSTSTGQLNILTSTPGNYAVINTIAAANGCAAVQDSVYILINPYSFTGSVSNAVSTGTICNGQTVSLSSSSTSYRAALLKEGFNGTFTDWTTTNNSTSGTVASAAWTLRPNPYSYSGVKFYSNDASQFYMSNSKAQGAAGTTATILTSPVMNTTGYTSLSLDFFQYFNYNSGETAAVQVSVDGNLWNTVATYTSTQGLDTIFVNSVVTLDAYINQPTFYVRFKYDATYDNYWAIDNVSVTGYTINNSYAWTSTPGGFTSTVQNPSGVAPTSNTSYTVVATNAYGCTTTTTPVSVSVNPTPLDNAGADNAVCNGSGVTIGAGSNAGRTYSWSPSGTLSSTTVSNPVASPTVNSTYTLTEVITATGCSATNAVAIAVNPLPDDKTVTPSAPVVCPGSATNLMVTGSAIGVNYQLRNNTTNIGSAIAGTGNTISIPSGTISANTTFNVLATVVSPNTGCNTPMVSTPTVNVAATGEWIGINSIDWNDANNWCSGIPTSATDVLIPAGTPFSPNISGAASCHNLTISSGNTLTIVTNGDLLLYGALSITGGYSQTGGTIEMVGGAAQTLPALNVYNIVINNSHNVTLNGNLTVAGTLTLTAGQLITGANTLSVTNAAFSSVAAGSSNAGYANGWVNGTLNRNFASGSNNVTYDFPVGDATRSHYAAVKSLGLTGISSFTSYFRPLANGNNGQIVAMETGVHGNYHTFYTSVNTAGAWVIEPNAQPSAGTYDITLYTNGFAALIDNQFGILKRPVNSTTFADFKTYGGTLSGTNGAGRKASDGFATRMGLTSFSEFGLGQSSTVLPIELVSFTAEKCDNDLNALLKWNTAAEVDNDHFDVEVATAGDANSSLAFDKIGEVAGNGTSEVGHSYSFIDNAAAKNGTRYYRLKQVNFDGTASYTNIKPLTFNISHLQLTSLYPNPVGDVIHFNVESQTDKPVTISIVNLLGQEMFSQPTVIGKGSNQLNFDVQGFSQGIYFFNVVENGKLTVHQKFEKF